ncbi:MAG: dockerin type I domain-containing protein [Candidatus Parcubacteria bacterium]|nr:dockerin type I domain-containing protein [Candidatus Parcubacteria bacterium]
MKSFIGTVFIFCLLLITPSLAFAQPGIPHQFYGTVEFANGSAPAGLTVEVKVGGAIVGTAITQAGKYGYNPSLLFAEKSEGEWSGETAEFYVDGTKSTTASPVTLSRGGYTRLNLSVPKSLVTPPSGGSGGGGVSSNPVVATVGDMNNDAKVNKYDFALMMVNWGKTGTNVADLNNDAVVNKYDFALLMARWSTS